MPCRALWDCAASPPLRHLTAVVAWHLVLCRGHGVHGCPRVVAPRLVRSGRCRCAGRPSCCRGGITAGLITTHVVCGCSKLHVSVCAGHVRPGQEPRSWCLLALADQSALRVVPFRGPVVGWCLGDPCGVGLGLHATRWCCLWTWSLTHPVWCTVSCMAASSVGAPGLFRVDANILTARAESATPGPRACVPVRVFAGRTGQAGPWASFGAPHVLCGRSGCLPCLLGGFCPAFVWLSGSFFFPLALYVFAGAAPVRLVQWNSKDQA